MAGRSRPAMWDARVCSAALLLTLHSLLTLVSGDGSTAGTSWSTLSGNEPLVIARGGFSGLFPDSSSFAYNFAVASSLPNVVLWCDVQLTKDAVGICFPGVKLNNASDISNVFKNRENTYSINGASTKGLFSSDFTFKDLSSVSLTQGIYSRTSKFDGNILPILTVEYVATQFNAPGFWLNIQNDAFYRQQNLSMRSYVLGVSKRVVVNYISSPDIGFLRSIVARFNPRTTKLVFRFLGNVKTEPSTNQTYGSLLTNLTFIKTFASGILVPKTYIWPVDPSSMYLQDHHTSVVSDAHDVGLEVYASDFVNDAILSYHYSYDPLAEYLNFVDNGNFSVDGVLSDFPLTPSAAIGCFSHLGGNDSAKVETLVISKNGASGDFPGCTDLAYDRAIHDGVDILDCPVQMSKDGIPFCLGSIDLKETTSVALSEFNNRSASIPGAGDGIYTFSLTWDEIQRLQPTISNPYSEYQLYRDPGNNKKGKFLTLPEFLVLTKNASTLTGVLISIENAAYLAQNQGLDVTGSVLEALSKAGYDKTTTQKVMIQSTNSSVLVKLKEEANYELVYRVEERIGDALITAIEDIKSFAHSVVIDKGSIFPEKQAFLTGSTDIVSKLHKSNLSVYAETFSNEFISQAWDFFSDATVEINSYVIGANIDGVITDFPKTAARYKRNKCLNMGDKTPAYMSQVEPGSLVNLVPAPDMPPVGAPLPALTEADVAEAPLPPVSNEVAVPGPGGAAATPPRAPNGQPKSCASMLVWSLAMVVAALCVKL